MNIPTIKVKSKSAEQGDFVVINESDFDAETHELYVETDEAKPKTKAEQKAEAALKAALAEAQN